MKSMFKSKKSTDTIETPPNFSNKPQANNNFRDKSGDISKILLPGISKNSVGIYSGERFGFSSDLWSNDNEDDLSLLLDDIDMVQTFKLQSFLKQLLISEFDPPINSSNLQNGGTILLRYRLKKLIEFVKKKVKIKTGFNIETEIEIIE